MDQSSVVRGPVGASATAIGAELADVGGAGSLGAEIDRRVAGVRGRLSPNDRRVLAFVREHLDELAFHTAESLAQGAEVSGPAVVRFARRLEFASFRELRDRARTELLAERTATSRTGAATILRRKAERDIASLERLPERLEHPLALAAGALAGSRRIWFVANRETYGLAVYGHRLMDHVRSEVHLVDPSFPDPLRSADEPDAVLACTFRPYARATLELVDLARRQGAGIVFITDGTTHEFIGADDIVLAVPVDSPTLFLSFTPAMCVLESLAAQVAMLDVDQTHDRLEATDQFVDAQRLTIEPGGLDPPDSSRLRQHRP